MQGVDLTPLENGRTNGSNGSVNGSSSQQFKLTTDLPLGDISKLTIKDSLHINENNVIANNSSKNNAAPSNDTLKDDNVRATLAETRDTISQNLSLAMLAQANASPKAYLSLFA